MSATAEERLARIKAQRAGLDQRLDEVVISRLRDHGKLLAAPAPAIRRQIRLGGWIAGAATGGAGLTSPAKFLGSL